MSESAEEPAALTRVREELLAREPIFHKPEFGTRLEDYLAMTAEDYWEVGASGQVYNRDGVVQGLVARGKVERDEHWLVSDAEVRRRIIVADRFGSEARRIGERIVGEIDVAHEEGGQ